MQIDQKILFFQSELLKWFEINQRDFPWRKKSMSNYQYIIAEVLLQRTKAETVAKFYPLFIVKYPSWKKLCQATESDLQDFLKPIGLYKQRGKRLYDLAQEMKKRSGRLPQKRSQFEELSMVGQYIANAYELFILKRPAPLLDVNMARLLERFFGPRKKVDIRYDSYLQDLSKKVVTHSKSKELNWAILDFAAIVCKKRSPICIFCTLKPFCSYPPIL